MSQDDHRPRRLSDSDLATPLVDEVVRQRLIDLLAGRWTHRVTTVVAPGGYGKSVALAQAVRDNHEDPTGIDVYVRMSRRHRAVSSAVLEMLRAVHPASRPEPDEPLVPRLHDRLAALSPSLVCLVLDDVHHLGVDDEVVELFDELISDLPANARLVLAGRALPPLSLSRLRAADQVVTVTGTDLAFDRAEATWLADRHGVAPSSVDRLAGWPAMIRLAMIHGHDAPADFLVEEVVSGLHPPVRDALAVAVLADGATRGLLASCGVEPSTVMELLSLPLVHEHGEGVIRAHDLWIEVSDRIVDEPRRQELAKLAVRHLLDDGRIEDAADVAIEAGSWPEALAAVTAALVDGDHSVSVVQTARWLDGLPSTVHAEPEVVLLAAVHDRLTRGVGAIDRSLLDALAAFEERDLVHHEAATVFEVGVRAWHRADADAFIEVIGRLPRLAEAGVAWAGPLLHLGMAAAAELGGDLPGALEIELGVDIGSLPSELAELALRHAAALALVNGRPEVAVELAERLVAHRPSERNELGLDLARFFGGDPSPWMARSRTPGSLITGDARDDFLTGAVCAVADAALGREVDLTWRSLIEAPVAREQVFDAVATACALVGLGDEPGAADAAAAVLGLPDEDPFVLAERRRFVALLHVLVPELRPELDAVELGPRLRIARELARTLEAARAGEAPSWSVLDDAPSVLCALPLPWTVELAARAVAAGARSGADLGRYLLDLAGAPARTLMRGLAEDPVIGAGAAAILGADPAPPPEPSVVSVCRALDVSPTGSGHAELRRTRVRQLLTALVVVPRWRRVDLADSLWPGLEPERARANLAITLTYLRRLLEPDRRAGEPAFHLRSDQEHVWLHRSPLLVVDLWKVRAALERAGALVDEGRHVAAADEADGIWEQWTTDALGDLPDTAAMAAERARLVAAVVRIGVIAAEARVSQARPAEAVRIAEVVLQLDPFEERAHAALVAAELGRGDRRAARAAAVRAEALLTEVGTTPSASTRMLWRRVDLPG